VEKVLGRNKASLRDEPAEQIPTPPTPDAPPVLGALARRIAQQQPQIQQMLTRGWTISAIARELNLDRKTVRRYASNTVEELMNTGVRRHTLIDAFMPYLKKRWEEGCVNAATLYTEIVAQGFRGSAQTVRHHLQHWRVTGAPTDSRPALTPRKVTGWIMRRPDELTDDERHQLHQILDRSEEIATAHRLAADFAHLLRQRRGSDLDIWAHQAEACDVREIRSFAITLRHDWDAVVAGLTLSHSNGATEGNVNRLKLIKRAMFGRAKFDLLRVRVLHRV
jgi:transposase